MYPRRMVDERDGVRNVPDEYLEVPPAPQALVGVPILGANMVPLCSAHTRQNDAAGNPLLCRNNAGYKTDHFGTGKCYLHGGRGGRPITHGLRSKRLQGTLADRIAEFENSPELLSVSREIATLKAILERQIQDASRYEEELEQYQAVMAEFEAGHDDGAEPPKPPRKAGIDPETMRLAITAINVGYNMQFSKRFSVPVVEVQAAFQQVLIAFDDMCRAYSIPPEARTAFGQRLRNIKVSKTDTALADEQLARAGGSQAKSVPDYDDEDDGDLV